MENTYVLLDIDKRNIKDFFEVINTIKSLNNTQIENNTDFTGLKWQYYTNRMSSNLMLTIQVPMEQFIKLEFLNSLKLNK